VIVVDTNVLFYFYLRGAHTQAATAVFRRDRHWIAPILWRSEFRNALLRYVRSGEIKLELAQSTLAEAEWTMRDAEFEVSSPAVLDIATQSDLSAYDSEFVALARQVGVPLVTADMKIVRAFPEIAVSMEQFAEPPI
jgi:predicted nucleic acid-binding protein